MSAVLEDYLPARLDCHLNLFYSPQLIINLSIDEHFLNVQNVLLFNLRICWWLCESEEECQLLLQP